MNKGKSGFLSICYKGMVIGFFLVPWMVQLDENWAACPFVFLLNCKKAIKQNVVKDAQKCFGAPTIVSTKCSKKLWAILWKVMIPKILSYEFLT